MMLQKNAEILLLAEEGHREDSQKDIVGGKAGNSEGRGEWEQQTVELKFALKTR